MTPPITPEGTRAGHDIAIAVDVDAGVPIGDVTAPLHAIDVERPAPERARVRLRQANEIPNRDFVLRWTVAGDSIRSTALAHRPADGGDGYVSVVLLPPRRVSAEVGRTEGDALRDRPLRLADRRAAREGEGDDALDPRPPEPGRHLPGDRLRQHEPPALPGAAHGDAPTAGAARERTSTRSRPTAAR